MSFIGKAIGAITGANQQADAAQQSSQTQAASAQQGIAAQQAALAQLQQTMAPFVSAGTGALTGQQNLLGLNGNGAQQTAINGIQGSPAYTSALQAGENSILANASATGGLRGGNVQGALAQFSPALLASLTQQNFSNLGSLSTLGQNAAAGVGTAQINNGSNISQLLQQQGSATAGGQLAAGNATANGFGSLLGIGGLFAGLGGVSGIKKLF